MGTMMVDATRFEADCRHLLDKVSSHGVTIVVTRDGTPVAKIVPPEPAEPKAYEPLFGMLKGTVTIHGDIVEPLDDIVECEQDGDPWTFEK